MSAFAISLVSLLRPPPPVACYRIEQNHVQNILKAVVHTWVSCFAAMYTRNDRATYISFPESLFTWEALPSLLTGVISIS